MKIYNICKKLPARWLVYLVAIVMALVGATSTQPALAAPTQSVYATADTAPLKSYRAVAGKSYVLPAEVRCSGDIYESSNADVLTINGKTGAFKAVKDGVANIVAINAGQKRYIKITVRTDAEQDVKTAARNTSALMGFDVTVYDRTTPATQAFSESWPITTFYFVAADNTKLGSITGEAMMSIQRKLGNTTPDGFDSWGEWFAIEFNVYRGMDKNSARIAIDEHYEEIIRQYRQEVFRLVNEERENAGVAPLLWDDFLGEAAQIRAEECASMNSIRYKGKPHTRPDGSSWGTVLVNKRYVYHTLGENSAGGFVDATDLMRIWMASDGHRMNILKTGRTKMGVGIAISEEGAKYGIQIFGTHVDDEYED